MEKLSAIEKKEILRRNLKFIEMAKRINSYLKEEGICLTFEGYKQTINEYFSVNDTDLENLSNLILDLNLWTNYFGELEGFIELRMLRFENKGLYLESGLDKNSLNLELEEKIKESKRKHSHYKLFLKHLTNQRKMFENAHRHCLKEFEDSLYNLTYKYE